MAGDNGSGIQFQTLEDFGLPGQTPGLSPSKMMADYSVKYLKANLNEPGDVLELCNIETRAIRGEGVVTLTKDKYTFMENYFIIISYMEKNA